MRHSASLGLSELTEHKIVGSEITDFKSSTFCSSMTMNHMYVDVISFTALELTVCD